MGNHDTRDPQGPASAGGESPGVSSSLALALGGVSFFALVIAGLGILSLVREIDIIPLSGLGQFPGIAGVLAALIVFLVILSGALRATAPRYATAFWAGLGTSFTHLVVVGVAVLLQGNGVIRAMGAVGALVTGGASIVLLVTGFVAAWGAIALRRTRASRPSWPWERDEDEDGEEPAPTPDPR